MDETGDITLVLTDDQGNEPANFEILNGIISYTGTGLDHETEDTITLTLTATGSPAGGGDDITASSEITITVDDVNEAPVAVSGASLDSVVQGGTLTLPTLFTDEDDGDSFTLALTEVVPTDTTVTLPTDGITLENGVLSVDAAVEAGTYSLTLTATDDGDPAETSAPVTITLTVEEATDSSTGSLTFVDENNATVTSYSFNLEEETSNIALNTDNPIMAVREAGAEAETINLVLTGSDDFSITNGVITYTGTALDYDDQNTQKSFNLTVEATGATSGLKATSIPVTITLVGVNEPPEVTGNTHFTAGVGLSVDISAAFSDPDGDALKFTLGDNPPAGITLSETGMLTVAATADTATGVPVPIIATDTGDLTVTTSITVDIVPAITVTATNPTITLSEASAYAEQTDTGVSITAEPAEADHVVSGYSVSDARFTVDTATGILSVAADAVFDFEADGGTLTLTITAMAGNGTDTSTGNVTVALTLTNDPDELSFDAASYSFTLDENVAKDDDIGTVVARDPNDSDRAIRYTLFDKDGVNENPDGFTIDDTGNITYTGTGFNFEDAANQGWTVDADTGAATRTLSVTATSGDDSADSTETEVTINLVDLAEPEFVLLPTDNTVTLAENVDGSGSTPVLLGRVMAIDPGTHDRDITYAITGHADFAIDGNGAITYTGTGFNYDDTAALEADGWTLGTNGEPHTRTLSVTATSGDNSTDSVTETVTISLTNVNELTLGDGEYNKFLVNEGTVKGTVVGKIEANDLTDTDRAINYEIINGDSTPLAAQFVINDMGEISYNGDEPIADFETGSWGPAALHVKISSGEDVLMNTITNQDGSTVTYDYFIVTLSHGDKAELSFTKAPDEPVEMAENQDGRVTPVKLFDVTIGEPVKDGSAHIFPVYGYGLTAILKGQSGAPDTDVSDQFMVTGEMVNGSVGVNASVSYIGTDLNYEDGANVYELTLTASVTRDAPQADFKVTGDVTKVFTINLVDVNEAPEGVPDQSYTIVRGQEIDLQEAGSELFSDPDGDTLTFSLSQTGTGFELTDAGVLSVADGLKAGTYTLTIRAEDNGSPERFDTVNIMWR